MARMISPIARRHIGPGAKIQPSRQSRRPLLNRSPVPAERERAEGLCPPTRLAKVETLAARLTDTDRGAAPPPRRLELFLMNELTATTIYGPSHVAAGGPGTESGRHVSGRVRLGGRQSASLDLVNKS
jgi:hypothetical protein